MQPNVVTTACDHDSRLDMALCFDTLQKFLACVQAREQHDQGNMQRPVTNAIWLVIRKL